MKSDLSYQAPEASTPSALGIGRGVGGAAARETRLDTSRRAGQSGESECRLVSVLSVLEAGQVTGNQKPLPRKKLGRGAMAVLVLLRIYVIVAIPIVGYAFVQALLAS